ncbi:hypothetical protein ANN_20434 [Periplaneta americana]|uniref:Uncharacterized protein n=1 Tax=Periplaneta americana TaxID=6978 RepID=A0ABQ8SCN9_PERAM|nr:hypothetical protein ANN_20434 [Periplaneta americana]
MAVRYCKRTAALVAREPSGNLVSVLCFRTHNDGSIQLICDTLTDRPRDLRGSEIKIGVPLLFSFEILKADSSSGPVSHPAIWTTQSKALVFSEPTCELRGPPRINPDYTRDSECFLWLRGASGINVNTNSLFYSRLNICGHVASLECDALTSWCTSSQTTHPPAHPEFQKQWDVIFSQKILDTLLSSFTSEQDIARLLALQESESGAWLHALPSPHIGTLIDSTSFKIAMALRLGCKLCQPHQCICGGIADIHGHHALSCARSKGRIPRHTSLNDIIKRSLTSCGIPSLLEPPDISRADGKRPDGLTLIPWSRGKSLIWDSTCVDTLAPSHLPNTSRHAASAAELAVKKKVNKYAHLLDNYIFVPFAVETFGPWSHDAKVLVSQICQILISITGDRRCTTYLRQRLSIAIQRGNAMSVLATLPESSPLDELFLL